MPRQDWSDPQALVLLQEPEFASAVADLMVHDEKIKECLVRIDRNAEHVQRRLQAAEDEGARDCLEQALEGGLGALLQQASDLYDEAIRQIRELDSAGSLPSATWQRMNHPPAGEEAGGVGTGGIGVGTTLGIHLAQVGVSVVGAFALGLVTALAAAAAAEGMVQGGMVLGDMRRAAKLINETIAELEALDKRLGQARMELDRYLAQHAGQ